MKTINNDNVQCVILRTSSIGNINDTAAGEDNHQIYHQMTLISFHHWYVNQNFQVWICSSCYSSCTAAVCRSSLYMSSNTPTHGFYSGGSGDFGYCLFRVSYHGWSKSLQHCFFALAVHRYTSDIWSNFLLTKVQIYYNEFFKDSN